MPVAGDERPELARPGAAAVALPEVIVDAGPAVVERFLEYFAAAIANGRTRAAYRVVCGRGRNPTLRTVIHTTLPGSATGCTVIPVSSPGKEER